MAEREIADIDARSVRRGAIAIAGGILFAGLAAWLLLRALGPALNTSPLARPASTFSPAPRLQPAPQPERSAYFAEKARKTGSYGWADREAGIARIPLEDAMRLMAARAPAQGARGTQGTDALPAAARSAAAGSSQATSSPGQSSSGKERR
jgi:hypothetical protein